MQPLPRRRIPEPPFKKRCFRTHPGMRLLATNARAYARNRNAVGRGRRKAERPRRRGWENGIHRERWRAPLSSSGTRGTVRERAPDRAPRRRPRGGPSRHQDAAGVASRRHRRGRSLLRRGCDRRRARPRPGRDRHRPVDGRDTRGLRRRGVRRSVPERADPRVVHGRQPGGRPASARGGGEGLHAQGSRCSGALRCDLADPQGGVLRAARAGRAPRRTRLAGPHVRGPCRALTEREREVLSLLAIGHTNPEIATLLYLSPRTVESHRANLQRKLGVRSRADLVRAAAEIEESESRTGKEDGRSHPRPP